MVGLDQFPAAEDVRFDRYYRHDLEDLELPANPGEFDYVLLLDVIEHLRSPERFVMNLRRTCSQGREPTFLVGTGNIAFAVTRLMLFLGFFRYGLGGHLKTGQ